MSELAFVVVAYVVTWLVLGAYASSLARRIRRAETELADGGRGGAS